jgi:hypothetical protein
LKGKQGLNDFPQLQCWNNAGFIELAHKPRNYYYYLRMKIFFLTFLFFHLVQSIKYGIVFNKDQIFHLYRKATEYYLRNPDFSSESPFGGLHGELVNLVLNSYQENRRGFLELVRQKESRQFAHFVFLALSYMSDNETWIEHSDPAYSPFKFFERAKDFALHLPLEKDWKIHREILSVLLSIQEEYLPHLDSKLHNIKLVKDWMRIQQEIISYPHDLSSNETLLQLFYQIQLLARNYKGKIPEGDRIKSSIEGFLQLFDYSLQYLLSNNWETSEITLLPPKLLYVAALQSPYSGNLIFNCLKDPKTFSPVNLDLFSSNFQIIKAKYEIEFKTRIKFPYRAFQANSEFLRFLRKCILKKNEYPYNLEKKDFWFIETFLYISSNLEAI